MKLYEINQALDELQELAESGQYSDEALNDTLELLGEEIEEKAVEIAKFSRNLRAIITALKEECQRLANRKKALEKLDENILKYLEETMIKANKKKIRTDLFDLGIQKNPPRFIIDDEEKAKELFPKVTIEIDKAKLKEMVKAEESDLGHFEQTESLRIR